VQGSQGRENATLHSFCSPDMVSLEKTGARENHRAPVRLFFLDTTKGVDLTDFYLEFLAWALEHALRQTVGLLVRGR
jgi:hypothetical protein